MGEETTVFPIYGGGGASGNFSLGRQSSLLSWTFDEIQNNVNGLPKDFGSMNMDEFLKNIWSVEDGQGMMGDVGVGSGQVESVVGVEQTMGGLKREGSLTLPRTISRMTVDEVYRDMFSNNGGPGGDVSFNGKNDVLGMGFSLPQRQPTFGEVTLEEFLVKAGIVGQDQKPILRVEDTGFYGESLPLSNNLPINPIQESSTLPLNRNGLRSFQRQVFPKPPTYGSTFNLRNNTELDSEPAMNKCFVPTSGTREDVGKGVVDFGLGSVKVSPTSPVNQFLSDRFPTTNGDFSSLSSVPYVLNGGRGKRCGAVEKIVERRQRRMIKNRESAARSRARKQAYTMELEAEIAALKDENDELQKKQEHILKIHKNQLLETMDQQNAAKKRCLKRTHTGPW